VAQRSCLAVLEGQKPDFRVLEYLVDMLFQLNCEDMEGLTPLIRVLDAGNFELALKMVRLGAHLNYVNSKSGQTILSHFVLQGRKDVVEWLLRCKALKSETDPHIEDMSGRDACDYAALANFTYFHELNHCYDPSKRTKHPKAMPTSSFSPLAKRLNKA